MALAESIKKGGRYTKKEQEERKLQVYHLHFEEKKSAVQIAEILNVNRNTINDDIKFWYGELANKSTSLDFNVKMAKQIRRMEIQRDRFLDYLEESETLDEKIRLEKLISDIDNRLTQLFSKVIFTDNEILLHTSNSKDIEGEEITDFVKYLLSSAEDQESKTIFSENSLQFKFILKTKCNLAYALRVIEKMKQDGLTLCMPPFNFQEPHLFQQDTSTKYEISLFALLRGISPK